MVDLKVFGRGEGVDIILNFLFSLVLFSFAISCPLSLFLYK